MMLSLPFVICPALSSASTPFDFHHRCHKSKLSRRYHPIRGNSFSHIKRQCAFHSTSSYISSIYKRTTLPTELSLSKDDFGLDEGDDEDDRIDLNSLGDWRTFRMNLVTQSSLTTSAPTSNFRREIGIDNFSSNFEKTLATNGSIYGVNFNADNATKDSTSTEFNSTFYNQEPTLSTTVPIATRAKSVSKKNEDLLRAQNDALADEYLTGVWAHESTVPEVGGLLCRMPLEVELYRRSRSDKCNQSSKLFKKLNQLLDPDEYDASEDVPFLTQRGFSMSSSSKDNDQSVPKISPEYNPNEHISSSTLSPLAAKTIFWYRKAEKLIQLEMRRIVQMANTNGKIDVSKLEEESLELLQLYAEHQQTWQQVCLVIEKDEKTGNAKSITINRPMAFKLSESMGRLVLFGTYQATQINKNGIVEKKRVSGTETQNLVKFLAAFENECGVYFGGPNDMEEPAIMIHGISDLSGAVEVSPGTGIYIGGIEAAIDGVLMGKFKPLDFRFFIGHSKYDGGKLNQAIELSKFQPVACSRPLVLKQCIQLPKPLWHEG